MTQNVHANIRAAARQLLGTVSGAPAAKAWEGEVFTPVRGTPYLSESARPGPSVVRGVGSGGAQQHTIRLNWTLHYPAGKGTAAIESAASAIMDAFKPGTGLAYSTQTGTIMQCERTPLVPDPDWISCTVTATVTAYTFG
jgi:hypothetical protein